MAGFGGGGSRWGREVDEIEVDSAIGGGLLDIAGDDYMSDFGDDFFGGDDDVAGDYGGLIGEDRDFYDEDEDYQGQMMDQYTEDFEGNYDARNIGTKIADWFEKRNPIIQGLRKLGVDARLDRTLGTGNDLDDEGNRIGDSDRDDQVAENACAATGGTWDGGQCIMPSTDNGDDDNGDNGDGIDYGAFGKPDPFASINRKRRMFYHPMLETTAYSGERPDYIDENIWDYKPPQLRNWAGGLRKWASGD